MSTNRSPDPRAGAVAGAIGGAIAGFVKLGWEKPFPPLPPGREPEPKVLVEKLTHAPAPPWSIYAIHFGMSISTGALYGALVEVAPIVGIGAGTGYGAAVWIGAHEIAMPRAGLTPPVAQLTAQEQLSESFGHLLWGYAIELCRAALRDRFASDADVSPAGDAALT